MSNMNSALAIEKAALAVVLLAGVFLFAVMFKLTDAVPAEYRSASPGFSWTWDFDYGTALKEAGRPGAAPWPWPATRTGSRLLLPVDQPLQADGLELVYRGLSDSGRLRLDIVIQNLDAGFTYRREFDPDKAASGFSIANRRFALERATPRYARLRAISR